MINRTYFINGDEISLQNICYVSKIQHDGIRYSFEVWYGRNFSYKVVGEEEEIQEHRKAIIMLCNDIE